MFLRVTCRVIRVVLFTVFFTVKIRFLPFEKRFNMSDKFEYKLHGNAYPEYEVLLKIGDGTYGNVYKAKHKKSGEIVAFKEFICDDAIEELPKPAVSEIDAYKQLKHDNIITFLDHMKITILENAELKYYGVLMFECGHFTLKSFMFKPGFIIENLEIKTIMRQLLSGLNYMHTNDFLHRDLKPSNIVITKEGITKIIDLGMSKKLPTIGVDSEIIMTNRVGLRSYKAPELYFGDVHYGKSIDVWSVGCIFYEFYSRKLLFEGTDGKDVLDKIMKSCGTPIDGIWPDVKKLPFYENLKDSTSRERKITDDFKKIAKDELSHDLFDNFIVYDPEKRITCSDALKHNYFAKCNQPDVSELVKRFDAYQQDEKANEKER
ncbi:cyclin-dependent kinase 2-like [Planococcus citri]|uniref:cyclin-dependent kinase 2-like n=1 Tax=Planococcus citri TaxID=170843 RepID=UPI0031F9076E